MPTGLDLAALIPETVFDAAVSRHVERRFLMGFNRSYMLNAAEFDGQKFHSDAAILAAQQWMVLNHAKDLRRICKTKWASPSGSSPTAHRSPSK